MIRGKKILLGVTGSIAAYKAILLVRLLVKAGAEVRVVITPAAADFVSVLTLSTLSKNKVLSVLADGETWANHVMLGRWADVMLIAPLSCNTLAKMAGGFCDNLLLAIYLSATCPVVVAPAMDEDMWHHPSTRRNLATILDFGNAVIPVNNGELASGLYGEGRMSEPDDILTYLEETYFRESQLAGKSVLISAGPTYEAIDPVRFIGNHSSGKMGFALAEQFFAAGANVQVVCGPTSEHTKYRGIKVSNVVSASEMFDSCLSIFSTSDIIVMAAAVADYRPLNQETQKIKKESGTISLELTKTKDILKHFGEIKNENQFLAGFALETENERVHAIEKLKNKNADLIVLNSLRDADAGFGKDTNKVIIFDRQGNEWLFPSKSKSAVAKDIVDIIIQKLHDKK
ncbi:bifunctional phosphopantothenoylcysteine decarboxylase/phosphopantothenate--cysteine ligase CoaBC [Segetibacter sp. 3557_3]|uniref:bifunctional phosphopantothenoylcysteine decarboxylase/phosphopantothenate--cysteine ligase CoaBC n=1 Tax=Segetibacter sp. 3557_3 TaxID=2547429 RepID=UPI0010590EE6|nr:bifunctional phosphopantothenoylcysteine decarboxylase/phosphopantothenate--cysteine ligase CoaBC [Segetibacter sp. 3557_3]TDH18310.1 bifunctional phosphopantothenoylcysteine decarboxylase/phosphopantothenate--cysteine ligase CoaBC [Segetibacter sp. 3557_3]